MSGLHVVACCQYGRTLSCPNCGVFACRPRRQVMHGWLGIFKRQRTGPRPMLLRKHASGKKSGTPLTGQLTFLMKGNLPFEEDQWKVTHSQLSHMFQKALLTDHTMHPVYADIPQWYGPVLSACSITVWADILLLAHPVQAPSIGSMG